jgi:hypothetical protein
MSDTNDEYDVLDTNVNDDNADSDTSVDVGDVSTDSLTTLLDVTVSIEIPNHRWADDSWFTKESDLYYKNFYIVEMKKGKTFPLLITDKYCEYNSKLDAIFGTSINSQRREGGNLAMDNLIGSHIHTWCNITGDSLTVLLSQRRLVAMVVYKFQRPSRHGVVPKILMQCMKHDGKVGYLQLGYPTVLENLTHKFTQRAKTYRKNAVTAR